MKPRNIRELRNLPISEMTDEEIVKSAMDRLQVKTIMMGYLDEGKWIFHWRYKKGCLPFITGLKHHIEVWFGCKLLKIGEDDQ